MKHILIILLFIITAGKAQDNPAIPVKLLSDFKAGPEQYIGTDSYGNTYTVKDNELRKDAGNAIVKYKNLSFGDIYKVDLQNPLQIVIFYRKFNTVVLLDNQLNEIKRINFSGLQLQQPVVAEAAGLASQNRLWIYDVNRQQIGLYNINHQDFKTITPPFSDPVKFYQNDYNYFYWIDAGSKLYVVNLFGSVRLLGDIPGYEQVQILDNKKALVKKDDVLYLYTYDNANYKRIDIAEKTFNSFYYKEQILTIFTSTDNKQYKITLPK